jgi:hypothetical protein
MWGRFYPRQKLNPAEVAKTWKFTNDGLLIWKDTNFDGMEFKGRYYGQPDNDELAKWVRSKKTGMVLEVDFSHWVWVYYYPLSTGISGCFIIDPLGGKIKPFALTGYRCTGYALFAKDDVSKH